MGRSEKSRLAFVLLFASIFLLACPGVAFAACGVVTPNSGQCKPDYDPTNLVGACTALTPKGPDCCAEVAGCTWNGNYQECRADGSGTTPYLYCDNFNNNEAGCISFGTTCNWLQMEQTCGIPGGWPGGTCYATSQASPGEVTCTDVTSKACCDKTTGCYWDAGNMRCKANSGTKGNVACPQFNENLNGCQSFHYACTFGWLQCGLAGDDCSAENGGTQCCNGLTCLNDNYCCVTSGNACAQDSDCCPGKSCLLKGATKQCCIADNSATSCNYGSDCCSGICDSHVCQPAACAVVPTIPSYTDVTLDPKYGKINTFTYNLSEKDYVKTGVPNALLFMVNLTNQASPNICYMVADSTGHMQMDYDPQLPGCTDYWFIFCPDGKGAQNSAEGLKARETCLNSTKINYAALIYPAPQPCSSASQPAPKSYLDHILSHNELYFCNKVTKDYAPLCWPLMLILGLLLGASFAAGKNPFHAFDFSSPRMNRGRQYSMRVQNKSFDFLSYIMGAATTAMSAKSMAKSLSKGGGFGAMLKAEAKAAFNPVGNMKDTIANAKASMGALGKADAALSKAATNLTKAINSGGDTKSAQAAYDAARAKYGAALSAFSQSAAGKSVRGGEIVSTSRAKLSAMDTKFVDMKKVIASVTGSDRFSPNKTLFPSLLGTKAPEQQSVFSPVNSQQVKMSVSGMIQQSGKAVVKATRQEQRAARVAERNKTPQQRRDERKKFQTDKQKAITDAGKNVQETSKKLADVQGSKASTPAQIKEATIAAERAKTELYQLRNWQQGYAKPELAADWKPAAMLRQERREAVTTARDKLRVAPQEQRAAARSDLAAAKEIGRLPSVGTSGATAAAYGARDTVSTIVSLFGKGTWSKEGAQDRLAASGADEYFKYAANASSNGQALVMLLQFALKKMMENAKLRDSGKQQGLGVQTNISFRRVNDAVSSLFRIYSVMSVLSSYTKGLGAATGSKAIANSMGFMDTINSASLGSIGKYNINPAAIASWIDPSLSQQMVGGGMPYPFNYLGGAVRGVVAGGDVLVQKFSDLFKRDIRAVMVDKDGKAYILGKKEGDIITVENCIDSQSGKAIKSPRSLPASELKDMQRSYAVYKDGAFLLMTEREAKGYDRQLANTAETYKNSNEVISQRYSLTKHRISDYSGLKEKVESSGTESLSAAELKRWGKIKEFGEKYEMRQSKIGAYTLLSNLPDMSKMNGEEQAKILNLREALANHIELANNTIDLIRCTEAAGRVLELVQKHQTRESLLSEHEKYKNELAVLEKQKTENKITDEGRTLMVGLEENVRLTGMALDLLDAIKSSGLNMDQDVLKYSAQIGKANAQITENAMKAVKFSNNYIGCYSNAIMMGMEDKMPDIASFQGRGADVLGSMTPVLAMVAKQLEVPTSVRFKDPARAKQYRASLSSFMDTAQEYMVSPSEPANQQAFASALEKNERTLLETVRFDGRFAGKQQEIQERLDQASRQRVETAKTADETAKDASKTMEEKETARNNADGTADRFIRYLADLTSATVALHQTSDSFISAQMAKSGWQDRAPYMSSPETEALLSTSQGTGNYVEGKRPSMVTGRSSPMLFGSNSDALYMKGAEFKVPPPMEQPIQLPYANDTNKPEERFANAEYLFSHHSQTLRSISPPKDVLDQIDNIEKAFQDLKKDSSNENNVRIAEDFTQRIQKLADAAAPLIKKNSSLAAAFNKKKR